MSSPPSPPGPPFASPLCQGGESSANPLPAICHQILANYMNKLEENLMNNSTSEVESEVIETNMFLEILKHFGIFIGMCASLALLTVVICHRPRKVEVPDTNPAYNQVLTLHQFNLYIIQPPDYDTVLRREEEGLPSYQQATEEAETGV
eukprot:TRINITY_DN16441_c0_g1_i1.p1 TRINITY_DN16441_c0_g1~~TRINITY_DN16441_c0_g1_i1.p1  ORF type:complete len:149 (-),score=45.69 TRINITY_DN16441_c0_g1_i1:242-688(-)